jgi:purine-binding chemotaxis protein CheW
MTDDRTLVNEEEQLVVFQLAGETYGVVITCIHEIIRMQKITEVPHTVDFIEGVINLRGRIIPIIDLRKRFNLPLEQETQNSRIMVVEVGNMTVGMIVDSVSEVLRLPVKDIDPPPPAMIGIDTTFLRGVGKRKENLIVLLDLERVLNQHENFQLQQNFPEIAAAQE